MSLHYGFDKEGTFSGSSVSFDGNKDLDLKGHKITNLEHPFEKGDAVNLSFVKKELGATKQGPKGHKGDTGKIRADYKDLKGTKEILVALLYPPWLRT